MKSPYLIDILYTDNKKPQGGTRPGAGRKPKYNEATVTVAFRLPVSIVPEVKKLIAEILKAKATANPLE